MENQEKFIWADKLRVAATIGVITVHASASIPPLFGHISGTTWWTGNIIDCLARFCVPVFVMLSGALLLRNFSHPLDFYRRRFSRIVFPFLFWSLSYSLLQLAIRSGRLWQMSLPEYLQLFGKQLIQDSISYHFWYVYMIIGLYILIPFAGILIRKVSSPRLLAFTGIWFLVLFFIDFFHSDVHVPDVLRYFGYLPLGYYLGKRQLTGRQGPIWLLFAGLGFLATVLGTFWLSNQNGSFDSRLYGYASPNILIFSAGVFMLFRSIKWKSHQGISAFIGRYSYGIYLVHVLALSQIKLSWFPEYPLGGVLSTVAICLAVSGLVVFCLHKLPGGKYISG